MLKTDPIGIFDSGVGGLTVVKSLVDKMPEENLVYFGDTAHIPYGEKTREQLLTYAEEIMEFMLARGCKAVVVACGTHSSVTLPAIINNYRLPLLGVVEVAARQAAVAHPVGEHHPGRIRREMQLLVTHGDLQDGRRSGNVLAALNAILAHRGVVPILNENDSVSVYELKVGDNDTLAALVTNLLEADVLVILTDQQGLYTADPRRDPDARLLVAVSAEDPSLAAMAGGAGTTFGTGGMATKVAAARRASASGADTLIASGREPDLLPRLAAGEAIGTQFIAGTHRLAARKQWLAGQLQLAGALTLDEGAVRAVVHGGRSLLPIGVVAVSGNFGRGDVVACLDSAGREVARGLANYSATQTRRIMRRSSAEIQDILGFVEEPELIHRSNMVVR